MVLEFYGFDDFVVFVCIGIIVSSGFFEVWEVVEFSNVFNELSFVLRCFHFLLSINK